MQTPKEVVLIKQDNIRQILEIKGPYNYPKAFAILEKAEETLGGDLYAPSHNHSWAMEWHYNDNNGTYWSIYPIDNKFIYEEYID